MTVVPLCYKKDCDAPVYYKDCGTPACYKKDYGDISMLQEGL